jgi:hypothetical protein
LYSSKMPPECPSTTHRGTGLAPYHPHRSLFAGLPMF